MKYKPDFHPKDLEEKMEQGWLNCEIFSKWKICEDTFYEWIRSNPEFEAAYKRGKEAKQAWWVQKGKQLMDDGSTASKNSFPYWIGYMNNAFDWKSKSSTETKSTQININNITVLSQKPNSELIEIFQKNLEELKELDIIDVTPSLIEHKDKNDKSGK